MKRTATRVPKLEHAGFDRFGSAIHSATPVDNQATNFLLWLARKVKADLMSPADVVQIVSEQDAKLHSLFNPRTLASWSLWERFWTWPVVACARPAEEFIRAMGEDQRIWLADPHRWEKLCEDAEKFHRSECRFSHVRPASFWGVEAAPDAGLVFRCSVHGDVRP